MLEASHGIIGTPVVATSSRYLAPAVYGDALTLTTEIDERRSKSFVAGHGLSRGEEMIAAGTESIRERLRRG